MLQLPTKEVVYFVAATVVLYNAASKQQRHYVGHTDDVKWYVQYKYNIMYPIVVLVYSGLPLPLLILAHVCARSIALHPDKITLATGQVAGHDKTAGKVRTRNVLRIRMLSLSFQLRLCACAGARARLELDEPEHAGGARQRRVRARHLVPLVLAPRAYPCRVFTFRWRARRRSPSK